MLTTPTTVSLAKLEAAQKSRSIMAFDKGGDLRRVARLQTVYASKRAQLDAFYLLFEETNPDFILRAPNGPDLVLRLPLDDTGTVMSSLRDALESALRDLEAEIVTAHLDAEQEAAYPVDESDLRPAILALCAPAATSNPTLATETPATAIPLPAGQRLFVTPPTRPAASAL
ncbi:MAG: hypothetical protein ACRYG7_14895 [Janthinobacterium lividum]